MRQILINVEPYEKRVAILFKNNLEEFQIERTGHPRMAGNIYKGIIDSIVPGIGALFVNLGTGKNGFLYIKDLEGQSSESFFNEEVESDKKPQPARRRAEKIKKGQEVIVQVVKEPISTKGPLITTDISIPGKYLVLMPYHTTIGISKKIEDRNERIKIKEILQKLTIPDGMGCIARTNCVGAKPKQLIYELKYLVNLWRRIQERVSKQKAPAIVYEEYDLPQRIIRDYFDEDIEKILVDSKEEYRRIHRFASQINPQLRKKIFYYNGNVSLYEKYGIESSIEGVFKRKVLLKSGGSIIIEQTEGLVAIDVNTGKFTGKKRPEDTVFKTNMEAAEEVAKQIMLRDVGGIIVIDFIDMGDRENRRRVRDALENAFKRDKAKTNILTISSIGLVEMTRQRTRKSLESVSFKECSYCNGMGRVKAPATIAIETARKLRKFMSDKRSRQVQVTAHPDVLEYIEKSLKESFSQLERKYRKKINLKSEPKLHVEDVYID